MRLFVTWAQHARRSSELGKRFGARPVFVYPRRSRGVTSTLHRYVQSSILTFRLFRQERPSLIFVLNQPIFLVLIAYLYSQIRGCPYVIDHHSGAFNYKRNRWSVPLLRMLCRHAALSFVTNEHHLKIVQEWGASATIIADVPFEFSPSMTRSARLTQIRIDEQVPSVVMVSTFSRDEPLHEVLEAARTLPGIHFYITGSLSRADRSLVVRAPLNVTFTNFLPDDEYIALLLASKAVLALTTRDHTLQRGAYEALSLGRPVITSDWPLLREVFSRGATYTRNTPKEIAEAVNSTLKREDDLVREALLLRAERRHSFARLVEDLEPELRSFEGVKIGALS